MEGSPRGPAIAALSAADVIWYVRPSIGGEYGPVPSGVIEQWLHERRIDPAALVWRDGWAEWKTAADVFVEFYAAHGAAWRPPPPLPVPPPPPPQVDTVTRSPVAVPASDQWSDSSDLSSSHAIGSPSTPPDSARLAEQVRLRRRQKRRRNYVILMTILSVTTVILLAALIFVLLRPPASEEETSRFNRPDSSPTGWGNLLPKRNPAACPPSQGGAIG
ncbi:MAG: DUF4339 domain-containing protein [Planctomycetota bacterium]|nr:MAG: DUF4339 domain-containing protein [Planctomycetota bacterium]